MNARIAVMSIMGAMAMAFARSSVALPQNPDSAPFTVNPVGGVVVFTARDDRHGRELWKYDPDSGVASLVKDILRGPADGVPETANSIMPRAGSAVIFPARDAVGDFGVWRTDGTAQGTFAIRDARPDKIGVLPVFFQSWMTRAIFATLDNPGWRLYGTDGTREGTEPLTDGCSHSVPFEGALLSTHRDGRLIIQRSCFPLFTITDGTAAGTTPIDIAPLDSGAVSAVVPVGDSMLGLSHGNLQSWLCALRFDPLRYERIETSGPGTYQLSAFHGLCFLQVADEAVGEEMWVSDGTEQGTRLFYDIRPGPAGSLPYNFCSMADSMFFCANDGEHGVELWCTDGTVENTRLVRDLARGPDGSNPYSLTALGNGVVFGAKHDTLGEEIWISDGTESGTHVIRDIWPGAPFGEPFHFRRVGDAVYFSANDGINGRELWRTDGTEAGTMMLADINGPPRPIASSTPRNFVVAGDTAVFLADAEDGAVRVWRSNGTPEGTAPIPADRPLPGGARLLHADDTSVVYISPDEGSIPSIMRLKEGRSERMTSADAAVAADIPARAANDQLYFVATDNEHGAELWRSDAPYEHARRVMDLWPGPSGSAPAEFSSYAGVMYFSAHDGAHGRELWSSATGAMPSMVADLAVGPASSNPTEAVVFEDAVYCIADDGVHGREIWRVPLDQGQPELLRDINPVQAWDATAPAHLTVSGGLLYFTASTPAYGVELWVSDGTRDGTFLLRDINRGKAGSFPRDLTDLAGVLHFSAYFPTDGREMWRSDGTTGGTFEFREFMGGVVSGGPAKLTRVADRVVFTAYGGVANETYNSRELWSVDRGGECSFLLDVRPGPETSDARDFTVVKDYVLFCANDGDYGAELWRYDPHADEVHLVKDLLPQARFAPRHN